RPPACHAAGARRRRDRSCVRARRARALWRDRRVRFARVRRPEATDRRARREAPDPRDVRASGFRRSGWADVVWPGSARRLPASRDLCRQNCQRNPACRSSGRGADEIRARHQPQDRQGARPHDPSVSPPAGGSGDRVMNRRAFLSGAAALLAAPLAAAAQQAGKVYRVGYLGNFPPTPSTAPIFSAFTDGLREHGYVDGRNLKLEYRWAHGRSDIWPALVRELLQAGVQVVVTSQTPAALMLKQHASEIPVVLLGVSHPVEAGLVQSLARPGGNITGLSNQLGDLGAKLIQLCRELVPGMSRLAVFW